MSDGQTRLEQERSSTILKAPVREEKLATDKGLTEDLRAYLLEQGADLVGFGSVDRMEGCPEIQSPQRYLPDAVSMVSIALHINEACCDLIERSTLADELPPYYSFQLFTLGIINPQLDILAYLGAKFIEKSGYRAYPFPANIPHILKPSDEYGSGRGDISHKHVAVACGLGEIGWHNLVITPQFGTRQKLNTIVTNAPLEPDPMFDIRLCYPPSCGYKCALACPVQAIPDNLDKSVKIEIGGKATEYAKIIGWRCRWGCSGMTKLTGGYKDIPLPDEEPTPEELLECKAQMDPWQERLRTYAGLLPYCGRCFAVCPLRVEDE